MSFGTPYLIGPSTVGTGVTQTITPVTATAAGDAIIVACGCSSTSVAVSSVTDSKSNSYAAATGAVTSYEFGQVWIATGTTALGTSDTITVTYSTTSGEKLAVAVGASGVASSSAVDTGAVASAESNTATPSVTSGTMATSSELVIGVLACKDTSGVPVVASPFTQVTEQQSGSSPYITVAYLDASSTAAVTFSASITAANWSAFAVPLAAGVTYYVSPTGSDSNNGTSATTPWQTVAKVNSSQSLFAAGDSILFEGGQTFSGTMLYVTTGGTAAIPITYGSYGTGNAVISMGTNDAAYVYNAGGVAFSNINFTGISGSTSYVGLQFYCSGTGSLPAITITNCPCAGWNQGISIGGNTATDGYSGITITGCSANGNITQGITVYGTSATSYNHQNLLISNCTASNNTGSSSNTTSASGYGMSVGGVSGGTITGCTATGNGASNGYTSGGPVGIMVYDSKSVTITKSLSYSNSSGTSADGDGFDLDTGCVDCTIEYCLSYSNKGAGILLDGVSSTWTGNACRYNICWGNATGHSGYGEIVIYGDVASSNIYGNTLVAQANGSVYSIPLLVTANTTISGITARNNIFYGAGSNPVAEASAALTSSELLLQGNLYYSPGTFSISWGGTSYASLAAFQSGVSGEETYSGSSTGIEANPLLVSAGTAPTVTTAATMTGYTGAQLQGGSPAAGAGLNLNADFGISYGTQDFYGNSLALPLWVGAFQPVSAAAALSGTGTLSPAAGVSVSAAAALAGSGTLGAASSETLPGAAALAGSGALSPAAGTAVPAAAALSGAGTLSPAPAVQVPGASAMAGAGTLAAAWTVTAPASAPLSGTGSMGAAVGVSVPGSASLSGSGSLAASGTVTAPGASSLSGSGTLIASGAKAVPAAAALAGTGAVTAAGSTTVPGSAVLSGTGTLAAAGQEGLAAAASLAGLGSLSAAGDKTVPGAAAMAGSGSLAAPASEGFPGAAALSGSGQLAAAAGGQVPAAAGLAGSGTLGTAPAVTVPASAALAGTGTLAASGAKTVPGSAPLAGSGTMSAAGLVTAPASAALSGTGALSPAPSGSAAGAASLAGAGTLAASGSKAVPAAAALGGTGAL